jgi:hypothetical protein
MASVEDNFRELLERIRHGREFGHASFEPVYYLVFHPREILDVKRRMRAWKSRLTKSGFKVHQFSVADEIEDILLKAKMRLIWLRADRMAPLGWDRTNKSLSNALVPSSADTPEDTKDTLFARLKTFLQKASEDPQSLVLVTDLEALHPYMRIGTIESSLYGEFNVPTVFLYPGERTGKTRLKFLGFYTEDGNYRSEHVGG